MLQHQIFLLSISTFMAAIPAAIWLYILFAKTKQHKGTIALVFGLGCLTAPALLGLQYLWADTPLDLSAIITRYFPDSQLYMYILFGILEEITKMYVIISIDNKSTLIKTTNDTIRYSLAAALGFAFTENIYYLVSYWSIISTQQLTGLLIFRSIFTTAAHMIFSGVFAYYYAKGKFSSEITKVKEIEKSKESTITKYIGLLFNLPKSHAYQQKLVLKGFAIAAGMHIIFNYLLGKDLKTPVIIFLCLMFTYLWFLLKSQSGSLDINIDVSTKKHSELKLKDEQAIIELLGVWYRQERYLDVITISERLLQKDPDNITVKLLRASAMDKLKPINPFVQLYRSIFPKAETKDKNTLSKQLIEKETEKKVKKMIENQLKKEGKFIEKEKEKQSKVKPNQQTNTGKKPMNEKEYISTLTKGDKFDINY